MYQLLSDLLSRNEKKKIQVKEMLLHPPPPQNTSTSRVWSGSVTPLLSLVYRYLKIEYATDDNS